MANKFNPFYAIPAEIHLRAEFSEYDTYLDCPYIRNRVIRVCLASCMASGKSNFIAELLNAIRIKQSPIRS